MKVFFVLLVLLSTAACSHARLSCDDWCQGQGGQCSYIEKGTLRYNTETGHMEEHPTYYNCQFNR